MVGWYRWGESITVVAPVKEMETVSYELNQNHSWSVVDTNIKIKVGTGNCKYDQCMKGIVQISLLEVVR